MNTKTQNLQKHFASVLRAKAMGKTLPTKNSSILKFLTRKELIEIIGDKYGGVIPKEHNLAEMENEDLLNNMPRLMKSKTTKEEPI